MTRIQDILAKAERDGTARRTQSAATMVPPAPQARVMTPAVEGNVAFDHIAYMPAPASAPTPIEARPGTQPTRPNVRTVDATLHPALVAAIEPHSAAAEEYRTVRARLTQRDDMGPVRTVLITSPGAQEGKSITAANLALTMAQEFQATVLLIDADLRDPSLHDLFGIEPGPGLADVLSGDAALDDALVYLPEHRLTLLPAGPPTNYPTELLGSALMRKTLDVLRGRFDRILLDMTSVAPLADVDTVLPQVDGALMVVRAGVTKRPALDEALAAIDENKLFGLVMNDVN